VFDFVYPCHVIEHAEDIANMLREMSRVGRAGFIECPDPLLARVLNLQQHNWYITNVGRRLLIATKNRQTNITTREDCFYFHMKSGHLVIRHNWASFVRRLLWSSAIEFEASGDAWRVVVAQRIDKNTEECVKKRLCTVLQKGWLDEKKEYLRATVAGTPGWAFLLQLEKDIRAWRRNRRAPRLDAAVFSRLLA